MKKKIALVTGGYSGEAEISYLSAATLQKNADPELFDVYKIDISPDGWIYENEKGMKSAYFQQKIHGGGSRLQRH